MLRRDARNDARIVNTLIGSNSICEEARACQDFDAITGIIGGTFATASAFPECKRVPRGRVLPSLERVFDLKMEPKLTQACDIELTSPGPGQCEVQDDGWVKGTATIPNHRFLWVLLGVEQMPGWWWPQGGGAVTIKADGSWEVHVHFGQPGEKGKFEILVLVVDSRTNNFFEKWYEATRGNYSPTALPKPIEDAPSNKPWQLTAR